MAHPSYKDSVWLNILPGENMSLREHSHVFVQILLLW